MTIKSFAWFLYFIVFWSEGLFALTIEDAWRPPAFSSPKLSPDGRLVAVAVGGGDRLNLAVLDLDSRVAKRLTSLTSFDVIDFHWVGNSRLVFSLGRRNSPTGPEMQDGGGLFMVSVDGKESKKLYPTVNETVRSGGTIYRGLSFFRRIPGSDDEILAIGRDRSIDSVDLYRLNVVSGKKILITDDNPGRVISWVVSADLSQKVAISRTQEGAIVDTKLKQGQSQWTDLWTSNLAEGPVSFPLGFEDDNLVIASNVDSGTMTIRTFDTKKRVLGEVLGEHKRFDIGANQLGERIPGPIWDPSSRVILGFSVLEERLRTYWFDEFYSRAQAILDNAFPGKVNQITVAENRSRLLFASWSDRAPVNWYLYDLESQKIEKLAYSRPWLTEDKLVPMHPVYIPSRDGQLLLSYLFLPRSYKPGAPLPAIVHIHGGPWVRADQWGFTSFGAVEAQLLANQGFIVLLPNFRLTPGLGSDIFYGGRRQFGKRMQEDIEDATRWLIAQGYALETKIALSGASYGGYATLMGLATSPSMYQCGIAGLAVTDLALLMSSGQGDIPQNPFGLALWKELAGDPMRDKKQLDSVSPVYLARNIKVPVLMYSGGSDIRVPMEQPERMKRALEAVGNPPDFLVHPEEGHGFGTMQANKVTYEKIFGFLNRCLNGSR